MRTKLRALYNDVLFPLILLALPVSSVFTSYNSSTPFGKEYVLGLSFSISWSFFSVFLLIMRYVFGLADRRFNSLRDFVFRDAHVQIEQRAVTLPGKKRRNR
jgi:hypothetical protein